MVLNVKYWYKTGTVEYSSYYSQATSSLKRAKTRENNLALIREVDTTLKTSPVLQLKTVYHVKIDNNTIKITHFCKLLSSSVETVQHSNLVFLYFVAKYTDNSFPKSLQSRLMTGEIT